jgi:hypothetical protein
MRIFQENSTTLSECKPLKEISKMKMRRLFKRGERVRSKVDGKVMEVLRYIKNNLVEVMTFDIESKEVRTKHVREDKISRAA